MADAHFHAVSSTRRFGGSVEDYIGIHAWFDESKTSMPDNRHRALRHHQQGCMDAARLFGDVSGTITNSEGRKVPVKTIGEQHVSEDMGGYVPSVQDWLREMPLKPWMCRGARRLSRELEEVRA
jgi:hypothetical protein